MSRTAVHGLRFVAVGQDDALAEPLLAELAVEYATRYGGTTEDGSVAGCAVTRRTNSRRRDGGMLIGAARRRARSTGGAFRRFESPRSTAELKRIWTDSGHRRRGLARVLLAELEADDRRARIPSRLPDHRRPPAGGRGALPGHRLPQAGRAAPGRGRGLPDGVRQGSAMTEPLRVGRRIRGLRLASRGVAAHRRPPAGPAAVGTGRAGRDGRARPARLHHRSTTA